MSIGNQLVRSLGGGRFHWKLRNYSLQIKIETKYCYAERPCLLVGDEF
ncbi:MAG: hypothetical protein ACM3PT_00470 [Deltaproteobacteria bacterium]